MAALDDDRVAEVARVVLAGMEARYKSLYDAEFNAYVLEKGAPPVGCKVSIAADGEPAIEFFGWEDIYARA